MLAGSGAFLARLAQVDNSEIEPNGLENALSNRVHMFAPFEVKDEFIRCFQTVLGCGKPQVILGAGEHVSLIAFRFAGGGALSVEFNRDAQSCVAIRHGVWLELLTPDAAALRARIIAEGYERVTYAATNGFYFKAPGGQVIGIRGVPSPKGQ